MLLRGEDILSSRRSLYTSDDGARFKTAKPEQEADLDITPMIDVTFLLLIFFILTSTMDPAEALDLPKAKHGTGVKAEETTEITLKIGSGKSATIFLKDGREVDLDEVRRHVEERMSANVTKVMIKAERELSHGAVQEVASTIAEIDGVEFFIAVDNKDQ